MCVKAQAENLTQVIAKIQGFFFQRKMRINSLNMLTPITSGTEYLCKFEKEKGDGRFQRTVNMRE